ncbi:MAG: SDR family oxidoreductase [Ignavibacteria bacterium]|nr:SDR family oxidoreductase [Ignavibacteria bacterium]
MNVLIIGATGGTGRQLVSQALERGYRVTAFVRNPHKLTLRHERLSIAQGNVLDYRTVEAAVQGVDAVISALGHKRWFLPSTILSEGTRNILTAMERHGVRRLICETSLGIGDSRGRLGVYYTFFVIPFMTYFYFRDKERQEEIISLSPLDYTIVRPGQLTNGRKRGTYRYGANLGSYFLTRTISRSDVADFMLNQLSTDKHLRKAVVIVS